MRIAFITPEFITEPSTFDGGLANYLYRVALSLIKLGHTPTIIVTSDKNEVFHYNSIEVHRVEIEKKYNPPLGWIYQSYILNKYLGEIHQHNPFDIIQHTSFTATGIYKLNTVPSIVRISSIHSLLSYNYKMKQDEANMLSERLEIFSLRNADSVFGPSTILAEEYKKISGIDVKVIESPYLGTIINQDASLYNKFLQGKQYLLFYGTIGVLKGIAILAEIMHNLLSMHLDLFFVFIGKDVGYKGRPMMEYVYMKAGDYKNRIIHLDRIPHEKLFPIIQKSIAVVLPSRIDNFPNACIEAMANGKIVIGTKDTGFNQLITHKINGFLCEKDNSIDLLKNIELVLSLSEEKKQSVEQNAIKRIGLLKPEIVVNDLVKYYSKVISEFKEHGSKTYIDSENLIAQIYWSEIVNLEKTIHYNHLLKKIYLSLKYRVRNIFCRTL